MAPEELEKFVARGDAKGLVKAVASLTEKQRKTLSTTAQSLRKEIDKAWTFDRGDRPLERLKPLAGRKKVTLRDQWEATNVAVFAVCPFSQAKKIHIVRYDEGENIFLRVILDRKPDWIDKWINDCLGRNELIEWQTYWTLYQEGLCQKPDSDEYFQFLAVSELGWRPTNNNFSLSEKLAEHPQLLEDLWKFFEVETTAFAYDWYEAVEGHESWPEAIVKLAEAGKLDRSRLLDASLAGLTTGFKQNVLNGFIKFHQQLNPTAAEIAQRQSTFCDLCSSPLSSVVTFANKMLKKLDQVKKLDDESFVAAAESTFNVTTKGPPKAAIGLLKKVAKRSAHLLPQIQRSLLTAIRHPAEEIQTLAIELLSQFETVDSKVLRDVADQLDELPPTLLSAAQELIGDVVLANRTNPETGLAEGIENLKARIASLGSIRRDLGLDETIHALEKNAWPTRLDFDPMNIPVLSSVDPIEPISDLNELIDAVAHAIEHVDSADEVERILDGISRLCDQRPDDFDRRVKPLVKRIEKLKDSESTKTIVTYNQGVSEQSRVICAWLAKRADLAKPSWRAHNRPAADATNFINIRFDALRSRVIAEVAAPLLCAPTHQRGWIDPLVLIDRWRQLEESDLPIQKFELIQALLRLAPDNRPAALNESVSLKDNKARALRWALGASSGPTAKSKVHPDIWLAAARAKTPRATRPELSKVGFDKTTPGAQAPATYSWLATVDEGAGSAGNYRWSKLEPTVEPSTIANRNVDVLKSQPTILLNMGSDQHRPYRTSAPWVIDWVSTIWPVNLDAFFAVAAQAMVSRFDEQSTNYTPSFPFLQPLFDIDRPWSPSAALAVVCAANGRDQDAKGLAVDALIEAIADGRAHTKLLGNVLASLAQPYWLKLNRLAAVFSEVARTSAIHAWTLMGSLDRLIAAYEELPKDAHHVLALLLQLHVQFGVAIPPETSTALTGLKGSSKTSKLAKSLVTLSPDEPSADCTAARMLSAEAQIARAERWSSVSS